MQLRANAGVIRRKRAVGQLRPEAADGCVKRISAGRIDGVVFARDEFEVGPEAGDAAEMGNIEHALEHSASGSVEQHARYLQANRGLRITVQGNTDERGTREYNIALGQKRADAVKRAMVLLGATEQQIETVSFGKEKPRRDGHDEASWAENRRSDIVYAGE